MSALERESESPLGRLKIICRAHKTVNLHGADGLFVFKADLALALAVIEAAEHAAGLIDDRQYRDALLKALAAITKTEDGP